MSIHLNRKKILCISFFLCCVLPAFFTWFDCDAVSMSGSSMLEVPLLIGTTLFAFALLFEHPGYILPLGISSHLLLLAFFANAFLSFPVISGMSDAYDLSLSFSAAGSTFWIAVVLLTVHLGLFTTTEIAVRRLIKHSSAQCNSNH